MVNPLFWYWDALIYAWLQAVYAPAFMLGQTVPQAPENADAHRPAT
jgi:hypothetical protein